MHFARRMNNEGTRRNRDGLSRCPHRATAGKAEIDFSGMRMAVIAGHRDVAIGDLAEDLFDVVLGVPLLLTLEG